MYALARLITSHRRFQPAVMVIILLASLLVGLETYPSLYEPNKHLFGFLDHTIQALFTLEIILRILSYGNKPFAFFRSAWNIFDFAITAFFYLPFGGSFASVLRLIRILRVFRLITALPKLQLLVGALIKSVPSIGYVAILLFVQFYIFAIIGHFEFGHTDPEHFGNLGTTMITLFEIVTLEGWIEIYKAQANVAVATIYFMTFIVLGTMIILNLFIGVVLNGFEEVKEEMEESQFRKTTLTEELSRLDNDMDKMRKDFKKLVRKAKKV